MDLREISIITLAGGVDKSGSLSLIVRAKAPVTHVRHVDAHVNEYQALLVHSSKR